MSSKYILQNLDNYNKYISDSYSTILYKYIDIINNYIILSFDYSYRNNKIMIKKGIETLHHVFNIIFLYTHNLDLTCYHCDKATYYYIEFISQMSGDNNVLQLTSKEIALFVFKKTIFDLSNDNKIKHSINAQDKPIIEIVKTLSNIYNSLIYNIIDNDNIEEGLSHYKTLLSNNYKSMNYILSEKLDETKIKSLKNNKKHTDFILNIEKYKIKINILEFILEIVDAKYYNNPNKCAFIELFIKKLFSIDCSTEFIFNINAIKDKAYNETFCDYLNDNNANKLVNWLLS